MHLRGYIFHVCLGFGLPPDHHGTDTAMIYKSLSPYETNWSQVPRHFKSLHKNCIVRHPSTKSSAAMSHDIA